MSHVNFQDVVGISAGTPQILLKAGFANLNYHFVDSATSSEESGQSGYVYMLIPNHVGQDPSAFTALSKAAVAIE